MNNKRKRKENSIQKSRKIILSKFFVLCFILSCTAVFLCGVVSADENTALRYFGQRVETVTSADIEHFFDEIMLFLLK